MKFVALCTLLMAALVCSSPRERYQQELGEFWDAPEELEQKDLVRLKRGSCDVFSFETQWITPNHAVCAAHCMLKGYRGGRCVDSVCQCRS